MGSRLASSQAPLEPENAGEEKPEGGQSGRLLLRKMTEASVTATVVGDGGVSSRSLGGGGGESGRGSKSMHTAATAAKFVKRKMKEYTSTGA